MRVSLLDQGVREDVKGREENSAIFFFFHLFILHDTTSQSDIRTSHFTGVSYCVKGNYGVVQLK